MRQQILRDSNVEFDDFSFSEPPAGIKNLIQIGGTDASTIEFQIVFPGHYLISEQSEEVSQSMSNS